MKRLPHYLSLLTLTVLAIIPILQPAQAADAAAQEINWQDLMPAVDETVLTRYEAGEMDRVEVQEYVTKLGNTAVDKLNGKDVRIPGFLVPLNMDKNMQATELLLVPTMGACVHVPAPPPNQTVYVEYDKGIKVTEAGYTPYWLEGRLKVKSFESDIADTLYTLDVTSIVEYE